MLVNHLPEHESSGCRENLSRAPPEPHARVSSTTTSTAVSGWLYLVLHHNRDIDDLVNVMGLSHHNWDGNELVSVLEQCELHSLLHVRIAGISRMHHWTCRTSTVFSVFESLALVIATQEQQRSCRCSGLVLASRHSRV